MPPTAALRREAKRSRISVRGKTNAQLRRNVQAKRRKVLTKSLRKRASKAGVRVTRNLKDAGGKTRRLWRRKVNIQRNLRKKKTVKKRATPRKKTVKKRATPRKRKTVKKRATPRKKTVKKRATPRRRVIRKRATPRMANQAIQAGMLFEEDGAGVGSMPSTPRPSQLVHQFMQTNALNFTEHANLANLRGRLESKEKEIERLERDLRLAKLGGSLRRQLLLRRVLKEKEEDIKRVTQGFQSQINALSTTLTAAHQEVSQERNALIRNAATHAQALQNRNAQITAITQQRNNAKQTSLRIHTSLQKQLAARGNLQAERNAALAQRNALQKNFNARSTEISQLQVERNRLRSNLNAKNADISESLRTIEKWQEALREADAELDERNERIAALQNNLNARAPLAQNQTALIAEIGRERNNALNALRRRELNLQTAQRQRNTNAATIAHLQNQLQQNTQNTSGSARTSRTWAVAAAAGRMLGGLGWGVASGTARGLAGAARALTQQSRSVSANSQQSAVGNLANSFSLVSPPGSQIGQIGRGGGVSDRTDESSGFPTFAVGSSNSNSTSQVAQPSVTPSPARAPARAARGGATARGGRGRGPSSRMRAEVNQSLIIPENRNKNGPVASRLRRRR